MDRMDFLDLLVDSAALAPAQSAGDGRISVQHVHPSTGLPVKLLLLAGKLAPPDNNLIVVQIQFLFEPAMYNVLMSMFSPVHSDGYHDILLVLNHGVSWRGYALPNWRQFPKVQCHIEHENVHEMGTLPESTIRFEDTTTCGWIIPNAIRFA